MGFCTPRRTKIDSKKKKKKKRATSLISRIMLFKVRNDAKEAIELIPIVATNPSAKVTVRFKVSYRLALFPRAYVHPFTFSAYKSTSILLMQDSLFSTPILSMQYHCLVQMRGQSYQATTPRLCIVFNHVDMGQLKHAIETLRLGRGRGLLLSEMRGLRLPLISFESWTLYWRRNLAAC
jgi:hypothetical protein